MLMSISVSSARLFPKVSVISAKSSILRNHTVSAIPIPLEETKKKVAATYGWVGYNLLSTGVFAGISYETGIALKIAEFVATQHPLISFAAMFAITLPPLQATVMINEKEHPVLKKLALTTSNLALGGGLVSLIGFMGPEVVIPAALITTGVSGSLALAARNASNEYSLKYKGPLMVGLTGLVASGLCGFAFPGPLGHFTHGVSLYGGLFIFSALLVADVQEMHQRAHESTYSPIDQSLLIYLDVLNLFNRISDLYHGGRYGQSLPISTSSTEVSFSENRESLRDEEFEKNTREDKWKVDEFQMPKSEKTTLWEEITPKNFSKEENLVGASSESEGFFDSIGGVFKGFFDFFSSIGDFFKD